MIRPLRIEYEGAMYHIMNCGHVMRRFSIEIKRIRLRNKVSQAVLAAFLNTSTSTIRQWEQGLKRPSGVSLIALP